jgi:phosphatidate cytidylyltransferase
MLRHRVLSAVVFLPVLFAAIWFDGPWFSILVAAVAVLGIIEFDSLVMRRRWDPLVVVSALCCIGFIVNAHYAEYYGGEGAYGTVSSGIVAASVVLPLLCFLLQRNPTREAYVGWAWCVAGIFYVGWLLSFWVLVMNSDLWVGRDWVLLALFATFGVDTTAYFVGRAFGRHKMAPSISPGKTWEGAIGGVLGAVAVVVIMSQVVDLGIGYPKVVFIALMVAVFAQVGDLAESRLKRSVGVKEAGRLIPGHGGLLDRLDSIVFTGVVVYYCLRWFVG